MRKQRKKSIKKHSKNSTLDKNQSFKTMHATGKEKEAKSIDFFLFSNSTSLEQCIKNTSIRKSSLKNALL